MRDSDLVATIVAGDPGALTEAYDRYAARLYTYCRLVLPAPDAAGAVQNSFVVAVSRLAELRDPDRLGPWLLAVARNECLRRNVAAPVPAHAGVAPLSGLAGATSAAPLPPGLKEQVLAACTDSTPAGRAYRAGVAYRAGAFGRTGFPKPLDPSGPRWWQGIRRHPRMASAAAAAVVAAVAAGIIPALALSGSHQAKAATFAPGGELPPDPALPSSARTATPLPAHRVTAAIGRSSRSPSAPAAALPTAASGSRASQIPQAPYEPQSPQMPQASQGPSKPSPQPPPSSEPPPPSTAPPSPSPSQGSLQATPTGLTLTPSQGKTARGTFTLTAVGGPVSGFSVTVPPGLARNVKVSPSAGSLAAGAEIQITVTVTSKTPLDTAITVYPGALAITLQLSA